MDLARRSFSNLARFLPSARERGAQGKAFAMCGSVAAVMLLAGPVPDEESISQTSTPASEFASGVQPTVPALAQSDEGVLPVLANAVLHNPVLLNARPFHYNGSSTNRLRAADCLAAAAWYEAGNDPVGQRAVIQTVINRVNHPGFPNSVCGVVFQGSQRSTGCQFTFTCDGSLVRRRPSNTSWQRALTLSKNALDGFVDESIGTATHYHADYVNPWWSSELERLTSVGPHIFYRWAGGRGSIRNRTRLDTETEYATLVQRSVDRPDELSTNGDGTMTRELVDARPDAQQSGAKASMLPKTSAIFLQLDNPQASGRWAVNAMKACSGRSDCQVVGYASASLVGQNRARSAQERDRPLFLFVRDAASAMNIALWDCDRVQRPNEKQCLPKDRNALRNLMRERPQT